MIKKNVRILVMGGGPAFPDSIPFKEKYMMFSKFYSGDIITAVAGDHKKIKDKNIGRFILHPFHYYKKSSVLRNIYQSYKLVFEGLRIYYLHKRFDIIISPNPLHTGFIGMILSFITQTKLIIEVNGNFESSFKFGREGKQVASVADRIKEKLSKILVYYIVKRADIVKLVYEKQLKPLNINEKKIRIMSFPNIVPIKYFLEKEKKDGKYILLLGFPWYLKGVDILIKAFNVISKEFPEYRLKIVGWCPEGKEYYKDLAKNNSKIDLCNPVYYDGVIKLMTECSLYVLASRTDSSPRVLREAMSSKKPIIAANIDGVPDLIKDGFNGLLFEKENVDDLAGKIRLILSDKSLAQRLAQNGYEYVQEHLSERQYITQYKKMVEQVLNT